MLKAWQRSLGKHNQWAALSGVGGVHSSEEAPETGWSQGTLLKVRLCKIGGIPIGKSYYGEGDQASNRPAAKSFFLET